MKMYGGVEDENIPKGPSADDYVFILCQQKASGADGGNRG
jgi:hypothetical protein